METQLVVVRSNLLENEKPRFDIDRGESCRAWSKVLI